MAESPPETSRPVGASDDPSNADVTTFAGPIKIGHSLALALVSRWFLWANGSTSWLRILGFLAWALGGFVLANFSMQIGWHLAGKCRLLNPQFDARADKGRSPLTFRQCVFFAFVSITPVAAMFAKDLLSGSADLSLGIVSASLLAVTILTFELHHIATWSMAYRLKSGAGPGSTGARQRRPRAPFQFGAYSSAFVFYLLCGLTYHSFLQQHFSVATAQASVIYMFVLSAQIVGFIARF